MFRKTSQRRIHGPPRASRHPAASRHHRREDAPFTAHRRSPPALPAVAERLVRVIRFRRVTPTQPIAINKDNPTQDTAVIDARLAMGLRKANLHSRHLRIAQPEGIRHVHRSVVARRTMRLRRDHWVLT